MIWTYLVIYGIAFGILSSIAVKKKNRDQLGWFVVGFLFGVFGLIAAILMDKTGEPHDQESFKSPFDASTQTKKCPDCAETIKLEAKICRFCNRRFTDNELIQQTHAARQRYEGKERQLIEDPRPKWECPACNQLNKSTNKLCSNCLAERPARADP